MKSTIASLKNDGYIINNDSTPIAFSATALSLATHMHPIQALKYIFSKKENIESICDENTAIDTARRIARENGVSILGEIGDISEDKRLVGYLESITTSLRKFQSQENLSVDSMNELFERHQVWEYIACEGQFLVSEGSDRTVIRLRDICVK